MSDAVWRSLFSETQSQAGQAGESSSVFAAVVAIHVPVSMARRGPGEIGSGSELASRHDAASGETDPGRRCWATSDGEVSARVAAKEESNAKQQQRKAR